ncbi:hypothetical protein H2199_001186 [Coniosporium tulheliwenetii]|uniref:Uncharacterized protein n=1 Tax=Coniosporium tulheliwenetii TaxID=3383036 RepID=A0ACC2ZL50_9PEZI|nr:hypothetical protein H2199_001186 [Cladosporium sp. JES 115]
MRALEDLDDGTEWFGSIEEANQGAGARGAGTNGINGHAEPVLAGEGDADEDGDDDSYWAAYDRTPGRTPAKRSPAPNTGRQSSIQLPTTSELEYFARYAAEVQPAMDPHDPDEEDAAAAAGGSTLNGDSITRGMPAPQPEVETAETTDLGSLSRDSAIPAPLQPNGHFESGRDRTNTTTSNLSAPAYNDAIESPRPSSSASSLSGSVARLQQQAEEHSQAEVGIKQHISTDIKSLFRLARSAGIERAEFERIVRTELDCLGLMDMEQ